MKCYSSFYTKKSLLTNLFLICMLMLLLFFLNSLFEFSILTLIVFGLIAMALGLMGCLIIKEDDKRFRFEMEFYTLIFGGIFVGLLSGIIIDPTKATKPILGVLFGLIILLGLLILIKSNNECGK